MPGPLRTWNTPPSEAILSDNTNQWMAWITSAVQAVQAPLFPPPTPVVTTIPHPSAVQVVWNEVGSGTTSYSVYETDSPSAAPGVPFATVPANIGAASNSVLRPNITDMTTRYYTVIAIAPNARSAPSAAAPGAALVSTAATVTVSQEPVNQGGVGGGVGGGGGITGIEQRYNY